MKLSEYSVDFQHNQAIDAKSLQDYATLVGALNAMIRTAADERLAMTDEPSDYARLVLGSKS